MTDPMIIKLTTGPGHKAERINLPQPVISLDEISRQIPSGVYTTFRTYQKRYALHLMDHFDRLENSAKLSGNPINLDYDQVRQDLRIALGHFLPDEARVRVSIDLSSQIGDVYIAIEELHTPSLDEYRFGVAVVTRKMHRVNPEAKATNFILEAEKVRHQFQKDKINEILMISDDGCVLEGLSSNFFGIQNETIVTAGDGILPGITRKMVVDIANQLGYTVVNRAIRLEELPKLSEAFITSASRAILPVTKINDQPVGTGQVGEITRALQIAFQQNLDASLDLI